MSIARTAERKKAREFPGLCYYYPEQKIRYTTEIIPPCGTGPDPEASLFVKK